MIKIIYTLIKWLYKRYIDELYIPRPDRRSIDACVFEAGCRIDHQHNDIIIYYSRAKESDTQLIKNSGEGYIHGFWQPVKIVKKKL